MFTLKPPRVRDKVRFCAGRESLTLEVNDDPMRIVSALNDVRKRLTEVSENSTDEEQRDAAMRFASVIFGDTQAKRLMEFYGNDPTCVINVCGQYFSRRLSKLIRKAQTR